MDFTSRSSLCLYHLSYHLVWQIPDISRLFVVQTESIRNRSHKQSPVVARVPQGPTDAGYAKWFQAFAPLTFLILGPPTGQQDSSITWLSSNLAEPRHR